MVSDKVRLKIGPTRYILEIKDIETGDTYEEWITTDDIFWSMKQYQRNRKPLEWKVKYEYARGI